MNPAFKRLTIAGLFLLIVLVVVEMFAYDVIKISWVSFMEIQPAFQPMYQPLPVATDAIPLEGMAYSFDLGVPPNPITADQTSLQRGAELFQINCVLCHGTGGKGDGPVASKLQNKPFDLTSFPIHSFTDGGIFFVISTGVPGKMPALDENLTVRERWDVVNYLRTLK
ncbi:MAG: cytochrome c [Anaerolineales bacterium]|jgi:mono/diheme cytochrome c family protein